MAGKSGTDCGDCKLTGRTISATSLTQVTKGAENYCEPDVASHYDGLDGMYRRIWGEGLHHGLWVDGVKTTSEVADRMTQFVGDRLELRAKERVLDVGCGYGRLVLGCWMSCDRPRDWERRLLIEPIRRDGMLMGMADEREVRRWLEEAGAELLEVHDLSRDVERTWPDCLQRVLWMTIRDREMRRLLCSNWRRNLRMGFTLKKIGIAYVLGAMRYVVFTARRPQGDRVSVKSGPI